MKFKRIVASMLSAAMMLTAVPLQSVSNLFGNVAITASAETHTVTKTVTWKMDGGASGETTLSESDDHTLYTTANGANNSLHWTCNDPNPNNSTFIKLINSTFFDDRYTNTYFMGDVLNSDPSIEFLDIEGTVTKVEIVNLYLYGEVVEVYAGKNRNDTTTLLQRFFIGKEILNI